MLHNEASSVPGDASLLIKPRSLEQKRSHEGIGSLREEGEVAPSVGTVGSAEAGDSRRPAEHTRSHALAPAPAQFRRTHTCNFIDTPQGASQGSHQLFFFKKL